jgi:hypothetical protein
MNVITEGPCVVLFHEDIVMGPFFYKEPVVNGDTFLAMMENDAL